ncbi:MAG TPA: lipid II flippase MurJ [Candidatus Limnocylindrales bacterium]
MTDASPHQVRHSPADVRAALAGLPGGRVVIGLVDRFLPRGALLLATLTLVSYAMGLLRDRTLARTFGAGVEYDAFIAAFQLPELALDVLVASGLTAPFVPIFTGLRAETEAEAARFAQTVVTLAVLVMTATAVLLFATADATAGLVLDPAFPAAGHDVYLGLFRVMCATPVLFAAALALGEILVAERRFFWYALALPTYNGGIVAGAILLGPTLGIYGAAVGAVAGAVVYLGCRMIGVHRAGVALRPALGLRMRSVREFVRLMIPKTLSQPIDPLTFQVFTRVATSLGPGTATAINLARNFQSVPVSIIGAQFAVAAFPGLSAAAASGDRPRFVRSVLTNALTIGAVTTVAAVGLVIVGRLAIRLFLGGGAFDETAIDRTATVLEAFAISIPLESLTHLFARAIYATRNTLLAVLASLAGFAVTVAAAFGLAPTLGIVAVPVAFTAGMAVKLALLVVALVPRVRGLRSEADPAALVGEA